MDSRTSVPWEIAGVAIIPASSPSDVAILPYAAAPDAARTGAAGLRRDGAAIARVNQPALTSWLQDAINHLLRGLPYEGTRPLGTLIERGAFTHDDSEVVAHDWYGRGRRVAVARCRDVETARQLTEHLNALLTAG